MLWWCILVSCVIGCASANSTSSHRYRFWREMGAKEKEGRRVFGGAPGQLSACPGATALLDRYYAPQCSGSLLAMRWVLTAGHCISPRIAYVKYNAQRLDDKDAPTAPVHYLYKHPKYRVQQTDEGRGPDVTSLQHDIGLVRTRTDMQPRHALRVQPALALSTLAIPTGSSTTPNPLNQSDPHSQFNMMLQAIDSYEPLNLVGEKVQVFGFGRTEGMMLGDQLFSAELLVAPCERGGWFNCACAKSPAAPHTSDLTMRVALARGVCSGDSGGPVMYKDMQIGVTSMGPVECSQGSAAVGEDATSVFTALRPYLALINATVRGTDSALRMKLITNDHAGGGGHAHTHTPYTACVLLASLLTSFVFYF